MKSRDATQPVRSAGLLVLFFFTVACTEQRPLSNNGGDDSHLLSLDIAEWSDGTLHLKGTASVDQSRVEITSESTGQDIGRTNVQKSGQWHINIDSLTAPPCTIRISTAKEQKLERLSDIKQCQSRGLRARANISPEGHILSPPNDIVIGVGDRVNFQGHGVDPDQIDPLNFLWKFDGQAADMNLENPGEIQFNNAGRFRVQMEVFDSQGASDITPPERSIDVRDLTNRAPDSIIIQPADDLVLNVGDRIPFAAEGLDPEGDNPLVFEWDFDGQKVNGRNPGNVQFNRAGNFMVQMQTIDARGARDETPARRLIRVGVGNQPNNQPPESRIISPANDMQINRGDIVNFRGLAGDPEGDNPIAFNWNFAGEAPDSNRQDPGDIQFNRNGVFRIRMQAMDSQGNVDQTPDERTIIVGDTAPVQNQAPESAILEPANDLQIVVGDSVRFVGTGLDPEGDTPLAFNWDFDNGAPNTTGADAGSVRFDQVGIYRVRFRAKDNLNNQDVTAAERVIAVNNINLQNRAPDSHILSPQGDILINVNEAITFEGHGEDPDGNTPLNFLWTFDGAIGDDHTQTPGSLIFDTPGTYKVRMMVTDAMGNVDPTPAERVVTVMSGNNQAPNGLIISPSNDIVINTGDTVKFEGQASDPDGNNPLQYEWLFNGVTPNIAIQNPGDIQFNNPGRFRIRMNVFDNQRMGDPTPEERVIVVN